MRPELEAIAPERIKRLPIDPVRNMPVPWFVTWLDGKPELRVADAAKWLRAVRERLCWVCGEPLGRNVAFVIGPMCSINRTSGDPPSHRDCAEFSVKACPFLTKPRMDRRDDGLPEGCQNPGGVALMHNPGASLVWITRHYRVVSDGQGGHVFDLGDPVEVSWWAEGKPAGRRQVLAAFDVGLPKIMEMVQTDTDKAAFDRAYRRAYDLIPVG